MSNNQKSENTQSLLNEGLLLEYATLSWNVVTVGLLFVLATRTSSVAIPGFGLDSFIEIGASTVVVWQLRQQNHSHQRKALRIISVLFAGLACYIGLMAGISLIRHSHPHVSMLGIVWLFLTLLAMLALAAAKQRVGRKMQNAVLLTEPRVTLVDAYLAGSVLIGLLLNRFLGWWWADAVAGLVIVFYGIRESVHAWEESKL
jgi:divalent metal cation (Fe/Co/Zn/Cd) transporter